MRPTAPLNEDRRRRAVVSAQCDLTLGHRVIAGSGGPVPVAVDMPSFLRLGPSRSSLAVRADPRRVPMSPPQRQPSTVPKQVPPMWTRPLRSQPRSARSLRSCCRPIQVQGGAGYWLRLTTPALSLSAPISAMTQNWYSESRAQRKLRRPRRPGFRRGIPLRVLRQKQQFLQSCRSSRSFLLRVVVSAPQQSR